MIKIDSQNLFKWWFRLLALLICLPLGMVIPSIIRMPLQLLTAFLFLIGLVYLRRPKYILSLIFLMFISFLYYIGSWNEAMSATSFFFNFMCCWSIVIYAVLCLNKVIPANKEIFWILLIITGVTAITTIIGTNEYPLAVREALRKVSYYGEDISALKVLYRKRNIAGWYQLYGMTFFQGTFVHLLKKTHSKLVFLIIIINELCIIKSQIALATLISFVILFLTLTNMKARDYCIFIPIFFGIIFVSYFFMDSILNWMIQLSTIRQLNMFSNKLQDLYNLLVLHISTGDVAGRFEHFAESLSGLIQYPFGLFLYPDLEAQGLIGFHSELFDFIGTLGIFGVGLLIVGVCFWTLKVQRIKNGLERRFVFFMFLSFLPIFGLTGVFYSPQIWIGVFLLPVSVVMQKSKSSDVAQVAIHDRKAELPAI